jgi:Fur family ferric uptake transcriptional regulator
MRSSSVNQQILKILAQDHSHLTAQQVYERIQDYLPAVNPSTVYRSLERLAHAGMISVSDMGKGATVYESMRGERHHHLVCQRCGTVTTFGDEDVVTFFQHIEDESGFLMVTNHLILFGECPQCQK